jgi:hypothetical protein
MTEAIATQEESQTKTPSPGLNTIEKAFVEDLDNYINERLTLYHLHHANMNGAERQAKMKEGEAKLAEARAELSASLRRIVVHGSKRKGV